MASTQGKHVGPPNQSGRHRVALSLVLLLAMVLVAVGVTAGGLVFWSPTPGLLKASDSGGASIHVTQQPFDDSRTVSIGVSLGASQPLTVSMSGRVTSWGCVAGDTVSSGTSLISVDGTPLISLATATPLWRDLNRGDGGADVEAFTAELVRLGVLPSGASATLSDQAISAWRDLAAGQGVSLAALPRDSVPQSGILWLPADTSLTLATCDVYVGGLITAGQTLATLAAAIDSAHVSGQSTDLTPGARVVVVDDQTTVAVDSDGMIADPAALAALAASPTVRRLQILGMMDSLTGTSMLSTPVDVSVVPPAAIVSMGGTAGCVLADGTPRPVTIVSSQLGQSFVLFTGNDSPPSEVSLNPPQSLSCT